MDGGGIFGFIRRLLTYKRGTSATAVTSSGKQAQAEATAGVTQFYIPSEAGELRQGEILAGVVEVRRALGAASDDGTPLFDPIEHQFAIIVSQDCDLLQDFNARKATSQSGPNFDLGSDKLLPSTLFCVVEKADEVLDSISGTKEKKLVRQNKDERYQYLRAVHPAGDANGVGLPALAIDFKRYFTVPTAEIYVQIQTGGVRRCRLASPYLEHLSARFCNYLSRVALPEDHDAERNIKTQNGGGTKGPSGESPPRFLPQPDNLVVSKSERSEAGPKFVPTKPDPTVTE